MIENHGMFYEESGTTVTKDFELIDHYATMILHNLFQSNNITADRFDEFAEFVYGLANALVRAKQRIKNEDK